MHTLISFKEWKNLNQGVDETDLRFIEALNFKGYMSAPIVVDAGNKIIAKTRKINVIEELSNFDFSQCYLYQIERLQYIDQSNEVISSCVILRFAGNEVEKSN